MSRYRIFYNPKWKTWEVHDESGFCADFYSYDEAKEYTLEN